MNEQQKSDMLIEQSHIILDVIDNKISLEEAVKETKYWRPDLSDALIEKLKSYVKKPKK